MGLILKNFVSIWTSWLSCVEGIGNLSICAFPDCIVLNNKHCWHPYLYSLVPPPPACVYTVYNLLLLLIFLYFLSKTVSKEYSPLLDYLFNVYYPPLPPSHCFAFSWLGPVCVSPGMQAYIDTVYSYTLYCIWTN